MGRRFANVLWGNNCVQCSGTMEYYNRKFVFVVRWKMEETTCNALYRIAGSNTIEIERFCQQSVLGHMFWVRHNQYVGTCVTLSCVRRCRHMSTEWSIGKKSICCRHW